MIKPFQWMLLASVVSGLVLPLTVAAQDGADADADAAAGGGDEVTAEAIMAKPGDWNGKVVTLQTHVKAAATDEDKDFFQLVFDGGLRCRLAKAPIETKYAEMKVQCVSAARSAQVKLTHPEIKDAKAVLFSVGEEISVSGTVNVKGNNRVLLDQAKIVRYAWPKIAGDYNDQYNRWRHYGLAAADRNRNDTGNGADNRNAGDPGDGDAMDAVTADDVMASPTEFDGKKVRVKGHIQRLESGEGRDNFVLLLDGNLRCRMRRTEVEKQYAGFAAHNNSNDRTPWQLIISKDGTAKLVRSEQRRERWNGNDRDRKIRVQLPLFNRDDEIEITGSIKQASTNRILLEKTSIAAYKWPRAPGAD